MPLRNRVDPYGDLQTVPDRGLLTGNRGCLVDEHGAVVRRHQVRRWITCLTEFRGWRHPLAAPHRWTPVFFLDEAVALAAGHRPCAFCRRDAYRTYGAAVATAAGMTASPSADELDRRLHEERRTVRASDGVRRRVLWPADLQELPDATVVVDGGTPALLLDGLLHPFGFARWGQAQRPTTTSVMVLTPTTSVAALRHGFRPILHPSATCNRPGGSGV